MKKSLAAAAIVAFALAACGSDGGGGASGVQGEVADQTMSAASEEGFELDEGCVDDLASQLSDDDAQKILDAGDGDADLSAEGEALGLEMLSCVDSDALVDQMIEEMQASGENFDEGCMRDQLEGFDLAEMASAGDEGGLPPDMISGLMECIDVGG